MVYFKENPNLKWMIGWGTPIYGNPHLMLDTSDTLLFYLSDSFWGLLH